MRGGRPGLALEPLRTLFGSGTFAGATDAQLLERFNSRRDDDAEAAFAALVSRHGPMVRRACRSLLADPHDAEDAFQATFLVLARKAGTIRRPELLGNWLYGTAHRTARTLRTRAARRLKHESREAAMSLTRGSTDPEGIPDQALRREEAAIIHEEVARLPEDCRTAVVLCELEGRSREEIAHLLHCSDRTLRRRLDRARELLRARLTRRGLAPTAGLLAAALGPEPASAAISQATAQGLARAAIGFAAERATAGTVPASAATLAEGVISLMFWTKLKAIAIASGVLLAIGVGVGMGVGRGFAAQDGGKREPTRPPSGQASEVKPPSPAEQFRAMVKEFDDAMAAYNKLGENVKTHEELQAIYKDRTLPEIAFNPRFLALAERYPNDPVAVDALVLVLEKTMRYWDGYHRAPGDAIARTMEILARDHLGDARLGSLMSKLVYYPSPRRDEFLRTIAERSTERVVHGQAILALAQYLKMKGEFVDEPEEAVGREGREDRCSRYTGRTTWDSSARPIRLRCSARLTSSSPGCRKIMGISSTRPNTVSPRGRPSPTSSIASDGRDRSPIRVSNSARWRRRSTSRSRPPTRPRTRSGRRRSRPSRARPACGLTSRPIRSGRISGRRCGDWPGMIRGTKPPSTP